MDKNNVFIKYKMKLVIIPILFLLNIVFAKGFSTYLRHNSTLQGCVPGLNFYQGKNCRVCGTIDSNSRDYARTNIPESTPYTGGTRYGINGFYGETQYWPTDSNGQTFNKILTSRTTTAVSSGNLCPNSLLDYSKIQSDTNGQCCLTNDMKFNACYACFNCANLFAKSLFGQIPPVHSCNPSLGLYRNKKSDGTPDIVKGFEPDSPLELYGWYYRCVNRFTDADGKTVRYQPRYDDWIMYGDITRIGYLLFNCVEKGQSNW